MANVLKAFISGLTPKEKRILYIACAIVFVSLFDRLILGPISHESRNLDNKIEEQTNLIKKNLLFLQYKDKITSEEEIHSIFYTKDDMTHEELVAIFLREVEGLAKNSNVMLSDINPVTMEEKKGYVEYGLTIECSGAMKDMLNFMYGIESAKKPIRIASFEILPKKRDAYEVRSEVTVVKIIVIPDANTAAASKTVYR